MPWHQGVRSEPRAMSHALLLGWLTHRRDSMQRCFQTALDVGYSIAITPHLDDGLGGHAWRNGLAFDPLVR
jgi:hypothetical protein